MVAMGANYQDIDVVSQPLLGPADLKIRLKAWSSALDANDDKRRKIVFWTLDAKKIIQSAGQDITHTVEAPCQE